MHPKDQRKDLNYDLFFTGKNLHTLKKMATTNTKKRSIDKVIDTSSSEPPAKKQKIEKCDKDPSPSNNFSSSAMDPNLRKELETIGLFVINKMYYYHVLCFIQCFVLLF